MCAVTIYALIAVPPDLRIGDRHGKGPLLGDGHRQLTLGVVPHVVQVHGLCRQRVGLPQLFRVRVEVIVGFVTLEGGTLAVQVPHGGLVSLFGHGLAQLFQEPPANLGRFDIR